MPVTLFFYSYMIAIFVTWHGLMYIKYANSYNCVYLRSYGTARFKLDTRECSTRVYYVTRSECF